MKPKIAIVSFPSFSNVPYHFLSNLLLILNEVSTQIIVINGNTSRIKTTSDKILFKDIHLSMHSIRNDHLKFFSIISWFIKSILIQLKQSYVLVRSRKDIDLVIFYMAYPYYILPLIVSKILNKRTLEIITRSKSNNLLPKLFKLQDPIIFKLLDGISPESKSIINELELSKYKDKILPEGMRFIDTNKFSIETPVKNRENIIGFVGRITPEKGVIELINSVPMVPDGYKFVIIGDGKLKNHIIKTVYEKKITQKVEIIGEISNEELPNYLNQMKLLVLPTRHFEGLPTVILEAMACGTPVLATEKGGIKDVIIDRKTGFILKDPSPFCISENIVQIIDFPDLDVVTANAWNIIDKKVSFSGSLERFKKIVELQT